MSNKARKRELGTLMLAVSGAVLANLVFNGLGYALRTVVVVFMLGLFALGLWYLRDDLPVELRSRHWVRSRLKKLQEKELGRQLEFMEREYEIGLLFPDRAPPDRAREKKMLKLEEQLRHPSRFDRLRETISRKWKR